VGPDKAKCDHRGRDRYGKTFLGTALAQVACRTGLRALCTRARGDGSYTNVLQKLARADVLVLDDLLIAPLKEQVRIPAIVITKIASS